VLALESSYAGVDVLCVDRAETECRGDFVLVFDEVVDVTHCRYEGSVKTTVLDVPRDLLLITAADGCMFPGHVCGASIAGGELATGARGKFSFASPSCRVDVCRMLVDMPESMLGVIAGRAVNSGNMSTSDLVTMLVEAAATKEVSKKIWACIARR
jgi:hypothetical protein